MSEPSITLVIPAFNEAERIARFLETVVGWVGDRADVETIVVDDGSTDATVEVVASYVGRIARLRVVSLGVNRGKGAAVRRGLAEGRGTYRVFLDADGSTPIDQLDRLVDAAGGRSDVVVIGSTALAGAEIGANQVAVRQVLGRAANRFIRLLLVRGIQDTQRGCKLVSERWCEEILPLCTIDGWTFDVELLARSQAANYEVIEVPVVWNHVDGSKIEASSYLQSLRDVVRTWISLRRPAATPVADEQRTSADPAASVTADDGR